MRSARKQGTGRLYKACFAWSHGQLWDLVVILYEFDQRENTYTHSPHWGTGVSCK